MFKKLTGGLKSRTTKIGIGTCLALVGNGLVNSGDGQIDWTSILSGVAFAILGMLAGDHKDTTSGPDYRNLN